MSPLLKQFRPDFRPQYVLALDAKREGAGKPTWYRISVPGRPNGRTGWVRAAALELRPVQKRSIIYRGARRFEFWDGTRLVRSGKVAVGAPGAETPLGLFDVTDKFDPAIDPTGRSSAPMRSRRVRTRSSPTGRAAGSSACTERRGRISSVRRYRTAASGCDNQDIEFLRNRVPLGTPVKIV